MTDTNTPTLTPQEQKDEELIQAAFQHLIDTYLATNHRRKVEVITKAFNFAKQAHKGGAPSLGGALYSSPHCRGANCV